MCCVVDSVLKEKLAGHKNMFLSAISLLVFVIVWEFLATSGLTGIPKYVLPAPSGILNEYVNPSTNWPVQIWATLQEVLIGYGLGVSGGILLAVVLSVSATIRNVSYPFLVMIQLVPKIAIAPILFLWLGYGILPKLVITFLITFFPMLVDTLTGLGAVEPEIVDVIHSLRGTRSQEYAKVRLPNSLPYIFSGMKVSTTLAVTGALVAEYVGAEAGLGFIIVTAGYFGSATLAFAAVLILAVMGISLFLIISSLERVILPWYTIPREKAKERKY